MSKGLVINGYVWQMIDDLLPEEKAELLTALSAYFKGETIPETGRIVGMVLSRVAEDNARFDPEHKKTLSEIRAEAGRRGAAGRWQNIANVAKMANDSKNSNLPQENKDKDKDKDKDKRVEKEIVFPPELDQDYVREAYKDFKSMREKIKKPMTRRAEELILKDLVKLSDGDPLTAKAILEQSTKNCWQGVFALKSNSRGRPKIDWEAI